MTPEEYRAHPGLGSTDVKNLKRHPAIFRWERDHPTPSTDAMRLGTAVHALVLEDVEPVECACDRRTKVGKAMHEPGGEHHGVDTFKPEDAALIRGMADSILRRVPTAAALIRDCKTYVDHTELPVFWTDTDTAADLPTPVECKARLDAWHGPALTVIDLKTTTDARPEGLERAAYGWRYEIQAAHYLRAAAHLVYGAAGVPLPEGWGEGLTFMHVWVEKKPPHMVQLSVYRGDAIEAGLLARAEALDAYRRALANPALFDERTYLPEPVVIGLPRWAGREEVETYQ